MAFSIVEVIGGVLTNSTAIIADAFQDLMDAVSIGLAVLSEKISDKNGVQNFLTAMKNFGDVSNMLI